MDLLNYLNIAESGLIATAIVIPLGQTMPLGQTIPLGQKLSLKGICTLRLR